MAVRHSQFTEIVKAFGKAVRIFRLQSGCSQETLADKAKLDRSYMSQIERGIKNATLNSIWTISTALEVKPSELLLATEKLMGLSQNEGIPRETPLNDIQLAEILNLPRTNRSSLTLKDSRSVTIQTPHAHASEPARILVVDDDKEVCASVGSALQEAGFQVCTASSGMEAIHLLSVHGDIKGIVSDVRMSHGNGFELLEMVRHYFPTIPLFFLTGYDDVTEEDAIRKGASGLFSKPFDLASFISRVKTTVELPADPVH